MNTTLLLLSPNVHLSYSVVIFIVHQNHNRVSGKEEIFMYGQLNSRQNAIMHNIQLNMCPDLSATNNISIIFTILLAGYVKYWSRYLVCLSLWQSMHLFIHLFIRPSIQPSVILAIYLFICLSIFFSMSVCPCANLFVYVPNSSWNPPTCDTMYTCRCSSTGFWRRVDL
jgi:hypothetical protein